MAGLPRDVWVAALIVMFVTGAAGIFSPICP